MCYYALSLNNLNLIHTGIALRNIFFYLTQTTQTLLGLSEESEQSLSRVREKSEGSPLMLFSSSARIVLRLSLDCLRTILGLHTDY